MNVREWALPIYTILMQLAAGALPILWIIRFTGRRRFKDHEMERIIRNPLLVIAFTILTAMIGAHFHLSKPFHSFLAILNLRTSWLSREILFTVLFFLTVGTICLMNQFKPQLHRLINPLGWLGVLFGMATVYCMANIYLLPTQAAWNSDTVIFSFYLTTLLLGVMAIICLMILDLKFVEVQKADDVAIHTRVIVDTFGWLALVAAGMVALNFFVIFHQIRDLQQGEIITRTSLALLSSLYLPLFIMRLVFLVTAPILLGYPVYRLLQLKSTPQKLVIPVYLSCLLVLIGEILGRFLFYATHIRLGV